MHHGGTKQKPKKNNSISSLSKAGDCFAGGYTIHDYSRLHGDIAAGRFPDEVARPAA